MTYFINPLWFYFLSIVDGLKGIAIFAAAVFGIIIFVKFIFVLGFDDPEECLSIFREKPYRKCFIGLIIFIILAILIPSKETCKEMLVASIVTHENLDYTKDQVLTFIDEIIDRVEEKEAE